jgi:uncharacterized cupin superfamily protein
MAVRDMSRSRLDRWRSGVLECRLALRAMAGARHESWPRETVIRAPYDRAVVPEAPLEPTDAGLVPAGEGWFVVNARAARWIHREGRGECLPFTGWAPEEDAYFPQVGINLYVLHPGEPMSMYHWEADQEDFLVLAGEALLIAEGEERPLRVWDFVHCPPGTNHTVLGAGAGPCAVLAVGARENQEGDDWGGYAVDEAAIRRGAGVDKETNDARIAYARFPQSRPVRYRDGLLPGL